MLPEGVGFVEQHEVVPLRALGLVHRQRIAVGELVGLAAQHERHLFFRALEEGFVDRDLHGSAPHVVIRSEEHTSELQSRQYLVCRLLLEKKKKQNNNTLN